MLALIAVVALLFALFFSGLEVAFLTANRLQIELDQKIGTIPGKIIGFFHERPTWFIGTTLIGNIGAVILFTFMVTQIVVNQYSDTEESIGILSILIVGLTIVISLFLLYTIEFASKSIFVIKSNDVLNWMAIPFTIIAIVIFPVVYAVITLVKFITVSFLGAEYSHEKPVFGLTNLNVYLQTIHRIRREEETIEVEKKMLSNAIEFKNVRVRDCMIPRTEIVAIPVSSTIKDLQDTFIASGHSKVIVFRDSIDDVAGYCHSSALFRKPATIDEILTPIVTIPETTLAKELMIRLINERKSLAIAVDEFGGTSGMVSMEDVIEEIFGEIEDEHDEDDLIEQKISEHAYLLSARLEIDYLNETYHWGLPTGDYETLGGLILEHVRDIPKPGETVEIKPYTFIVQATEEARINTIKMVIDKSYKKS